MSQWNEIFKQNHDSFHFFTHILPTFLFFFSISLVHTRSIPSNSPRYSYIVEYISSRKNTLLIMAEIQAKVLFDFQAEGPSELNLTAGEIIIITSGAEGNDWW